MEMKKRTHKIFDRFTIPCALALIIISIFVVSNLGTLLGIPVKNMTGNETLATAVGAVISSLLVLWLFKFWFRPEFEGNLRGGDLKLGMKLSLIFVVYWVALVPLGFMFSTATFGAPTINTVSLSVTAGVVEEVVFRGLPGSYLMRQWRDEKL